MCYCIGNIESMSVLSGCFRIYYRPEHVSKFILYYTSTPLHTHTPTQEFISVVLMYQYIYNIIVYDFNVY